MSVPFALVLPAPDRRTLAARKPAVAALSAALRAEIETKARQAAFAEIKRLARLYVRQPARIDRIHPGASFMPLPLLYARIELRLAFHRSGCLLAPMNLRAARLAVRVLMLKESVS